MTDERAFQAGLDQNPANHELRLVFADWLEERGDWRAAGYRFMGERRKYPQYFIHRLKGQPPDWNWRLQPVVGADADVAELFELIEGYQHSTEIWKEFATRIDAEEALCRAILKREKSGS
jgi:uncharacterized protein (TIGR02996 family)